MSSLLFENIDKELQAVFVYQLTLSLWIEQTLILFLWR